MDPVASKDWLAALEKAGVHEWAVKQLPVPRHPFAVVLLELSGVGIHEDAVVDQGLAGVILEGEVLDISPGVRDRTPKHAPNVGLEAGGFDVKEGDSWPNVTVLRHLIEAEVLLVLRYDSGLLPRLDLGLDPSQPVPDLVFREWPPKLFSKD